MIQESPYKSRSNYSNPVSQPSAPYHGIGLGKVVLRQQHYSNVDLPAMAFSMPRLESASSSGIDAVEKLAALLRSKYKASLSEDASSDNDLLEDSEDDLEDDELFTQAKKQAPTLEPTRPSTTYPHCSIDSTKQIRVIQLQPGDYWEPICCELRVQSLGSETEGSATLEPFEALSYTWGGWTDFETITLGEVDEFPITCNLFTALRRLRSSTEPRQLWIDQLSIDQGAENEKAEQVAVMGRVYRQATQVIIWLGDAPDESLGRPITNDLLRTQLIYAITWTKPSWFTRAWVLQEYALSRDDPIVCFGSHAIGWSDFFLLFFHPKMLFSGQTLLMMFQIMNMMRIRGDQTSERSLLTLAWTIRQTESSILKDKVFSLLSLLSSDMRSQLQVDYDKSDTLLFAETTHAVLNSGTGMAALVLASRNHHSGHNLPSWVIDFGSQIMPMTLSVEGSTGWLPSKWSRQLTQAYDRHMLAHEWGETCEKLRELTKDLRPWCRQQPQLCPEISFDPEQMTLKVRAMHFDVVGYIAPQGSGGMNAWKSMFNSAREVVNKESRECMEAIDASYNRLRDPRLDVLPPYTRCVCGNTLTAVEILQHIWRWEGATMPGYFFSRKGKNIIDSHLYMSMETMTIRNHKAFTTRSGFLALGSNLLDVEDSILLPYGSQFPIALRKLEGGRWRFLGFVYVFGIMQGELMRDEMRDLKLGQGDYVLH